MSTNQLNPTAKKRISSIDILRGLVMLIMLLDHVRERFFYHMPVSDPINIDDISVGLFFSRILAHLCAPIFVFLTGLSAWLYAHPKGKAPRSASSFLWKRGLFLILIEITLINFSWFGNYQTLYLQVIWAIGVSMISLAFLSKLKHEWVGVLGFLIVFGHNLLTSIHLNEDQIGYTIWSVLYQRGFILPNDFIAIKASYPVLPWIGVILLGYCTGPLFGEKFNAEARLRALVKIGCSSLGLLLVIRGFNIYGETLPWEVRDTFIQSLMSFLNFKKYPPSLDFILLTIGVGCFLLCLFEKVENRFTEFLRTYGSAPMFFYILHLYVLLVAYKILVNIYGTNQGEYFGFDHLWQIWLCTIALSLILYLPAKKFSEYKRESTSKWIKYF
ncbi:DUF1624 domain-containing protein [Flammeovirga sp. SJP92]|uniref:DUF1624 domain-containing protein n=1 Tax=Flammeovirga sp. SJP92 TaxID=1775430 RepID=UPI00078854A3|nr:heparan-alpha-glucosaminide N-acetyltransferase domain-containing protein [Flammeovirga sp. SJP92]KXX72402.1 hypothetical protein AVL50_02030 [Flammeovirga sp. SJP92]